MGIEAAQGVAIDVIGVAVPDIDAEVVRLDSIVRSEAQLATLYAFGCESRRREKASPY